MTGRISCPDCGIVYHKTNIPPKVENICDKCGKALAMRKDDNPETVKGRFKVFEDQTAPLLDYYKEQDIIETIDGSKGSVGDIYKRMVERLMVSGHLVQE